ncbi:MAG: NAD-dependent epimerase/dehydratase family protein [Anaerolineales bacterium]|nr:NAD-dependent epimerase/dehydratase family protein [Anaerolineales bacterium]
MAENTPALTLVTGASGFIGRWLIQRLLAEGERVRALVLPDENVSGLWPDVVEVVRGSITERADVAFAVQGATTVYHLAAMVGDWGQEAQYQRVTVGGTWNVLQTVAPRTRVVLASSIVVYGHLIGQAVCDEAQSFGRPQGMYSRAKQAQEKLAWQVAQARNLPLSVVRPANVFGAGSRPWVEALLKQMRLGLPALIGDGERDAGLCYVENLVDLLKLAATHPNAVGKIYNGCDNFGITWKQYVSDLARLAGLPKPRSLPIGVARAAATACEAAWRVLRLPDRPPVTHEAVNLTSAHHRIPSDRARQELGYRPRVSYTEALQTLAGNIHQ